MSARGFAPVFWTGTVAGAALGFYLISLNVASERAALEARLEDSRWAGTWKMDAINVLGVQTKLPELAAAGTVTYADAGNRRLGSVP